MRSILVALMSIVIAMPLSGQTFGKGCQSDNGGTIKGIVKDSSGKAVGPIRVTLGDIECEMGVASNGSFLAEHVPPGVHRVQARSLWYMTERPVEVRVSAGKTSWVEIKVIDANYALECMHVPECAKVLEPDTNAVAGLTDTQRMREVGLRTAFAVTHSRGPFNKDVVSCIADSATAVMRAVAARLPSAVRASECVMNGPPEMKNVRLVEKQSGRNAMGYSQHVVRIVDSETFEGSVSYYAAPLAGGSWLCRYKKVKGAWIPKACVMTVIS